VALPRTVLVKLARAATYPMVLRQRRFVEACADPEAVQRELLLRVVRRQAATGFGRDHHFGAIRSVEDFRRNVEVGPYERLAPYVERMAAGDTNALVNPADGLLMFALTSGTTAKRKLIPFTRQYHADYKRGFNMWGIRVFRDHRARKLALRPVVQMVGDAEEYRTAGVPCGNASGFAAGIQSPWVRWLYTVPAAIGKLSDPVARYYLALRLSIGRRCSLFTAANPSTLLALGRALDAHKGLLLKDLRDGTLTETIDYPGFVRDAVRRKLKANPVRARELDAVASSSGRLLPKDVWPPETTLLGTWTGGSMTPYLNQLPEFWGRPPIRDLGLIASEGRFTIPFEDDTPAGVLDIQSHYFEFIPEGEIDSPRPTVLGAHELTDGGTYFILPTTAAGLYRYHISDIVRVRGFVGRTPRVEFLGKGNRFANLTGEKLSEHHVAEALRETITATGVTPGTATLAPVWADGHPHYTLLTEAELPPAFAADLDRRLAALNIEYAAKRDSGRLGAVTATRLRPGTWAGWTRERLRQTGGSPEQFKHPVLTGDLTFVEAVTRDTPGAAT
jgi:hypothetical protein